jgi:integrase
LSRTLRGTKREAQRELAALVTRVAGGKGRSTKKTVQDVLEEWLAHAAASLSPTTVRGYEGVVRTRITPVLGSTPVAKLTTRHIDELYAALTARGLKPASVRQVHAALRRSLGQAVKWGWIDSNPAIIASPPKLRKPHLQPPAVTDARAVLTAAEAYDPDIALLLRVLVATGLRRGEGCGLQWRDVNFTAGTLLVERAVVAVDGGTLVKDTKTHAARRIALDRATVDALAEHRKRVVERAAFCGVNIGPESFICSRAADASRPLHPDNVTAAFRRLCAQVGLAGVRLHDLRHMHATQLLAAGVPVRTVSGRLGHATPSTTLDVYAHFIEASDRSAADVMGGLLAD